MCGEAGGKGRLEKGAAGVVKLGADEIGIENLEG